MSRKGKFIGTENSCLRLTVGVGINYKWAKGQGGIEMFQKCSVVMFAPLDKSTLNY